MTSNQQQFYSLKGNNSIENEQDYITNQKVNTLQAQQGLTEMAINNCMDNQLTKEIVEDAIIDNMEADQEARQVQIQTRETEFAEVNEEMETRENMEEEEQLAEVMTEQQAPYGQINNTGAQQDQIEKAQMVDQICQEKQNIQIEKVQNAEMVDAEINNQQIQEADKVEQTAIESIIVNQDAVESEIVATQQIQTVTVEEPICQDYIVPAETEIAVEETVTQLQNVQMESEVINYPENQQIIEPEIVPVQAEAVATQAAQIQAQSCLVDAPLQAQSTLSPMVPLEQETIAETTPPVAVDQYIPCQMDEKMQQCEQFQTPAEQMEKKHERTLADQLQDQAQEQQDKKIEITIQEDQTGKQQISMKIQEVVKDVPKNNKNVFESSILFYTEGKWTFALGFIDNEIITLGNQQFLLSQVTKVKILPEADQGYWKLKLTLDKRQVFFGVDKNQYLQYQFPLHYRWFSQIITRKLNKTYGKAIKQSELLNSTKEFDSLELQNEGFAKGLLWKQSQHLKRWQKRFITMNNEGLYSYKAPHQPFSYCIKTIKVKYIWTRFDIFQNNLIIKLKHDLTQTQFAIPIIDFNLKCPMNWLNHFYRLMMEGVIESSL